jgi:DNA-binding transcriptional MerR regulator
MSEETYIAVQVCELAGVTYRQLDYWTRRGFIQSCERNRSGSGNIRVWDKENVTKVFLMHKLIQAGFAVSRAPKIAADLIAQAANAYDEANWGFKHHVLDYKDNSGLGFELEYFRGKAGEWGIPWDKVSIQVDQDSPPRESTIEESQSKVKTGLRPESAIQMQASGAKFTGRVIPTTEAGDSFQITNAEVNTSS